MKRNAGIFLLFLSIAAFPIFFAAGPARSAQLPFKGVLEYEAADESSSRECELKKRLIETISALKNIAADNAIHLISFESANVFTQERTEKNTIRIQFNLVSDDLLNISNFFAKLSDEVPAFRSALNSFSLNRQAVPAKSAGPEKTFLYYLELKFYMSDDAAELSASSSLAGDLSALIRFCGRKFDISSAVYTDFNSRLMASGTFSLKGTKKEFSDFMKSGGLKKLSVQTLNERDFGARPFHITLPFVAHFVFDREK